MCYSLCLSRLLHNGVANNVVVRLILFLYSDYMFHYDL
jgi:hypothetical protein